MSKKKIIFIIILVIFIAAIIGVIVFINNDVKPVESNNGGAVASSGENSKDIIEITDKLFVEQINDIYLNVKSYEGKTVKLEGLIYTSSNETEIYTFVVRNTPGCCGDDGLAGLEIIYSDNIPVDNEWVEVIGKIELEEYMGTTLPILRLSSMEVKEEKGVTFVTE